VRAYDSKRDCEQAIPEEVRSHIKVWANVYESATVSPVDSSTVIAKKKRGDTPRTPADEDDTMLIRVSCWPLGLEPKAVIGGGRYREQGAWVEWAWVKSLTSGRTFWSIKAEAFETKSECEQHARESKAKPDGKWDELLICFPAGTDPREAPERPR
jgi:hypothetical protein